MKKAVFLDRDGTIIKEKHYLSDPAQIEIECDVIPALQQLQNLGFYLIIVTNQSGIARGKFTLADYQSVQHTLESQFADYGIHFTEVWYCPHHPESELSQYRQTCPCRKPEPGMLVEAAKKHQIQLSESWMIGDKSADMEAGFRAGTKTILVRTGYGRQTEFSHMPHPPHFVADTLLMAVSDFILPLCAFS